MKRKKIKRGECYARAGARLLRLDKPRGYHLVHGRVRYSFLPSVVLGHAWLEQPDGRIWDPQRDPDSVIVERVVDKRYTQKQMAKLIVKHGHWGPWHIRIGPSSHRGCL